MNASDSKGLSEGKIKVRRAAGSPPFLFNKNMI